MNRYFENSLLYFAFCKLRQNFKKSKAMGNLLKEKIINFDVKNLEKLFNLAKNSFRTLASSIHYSCILNLWKLLAGNLLALSLIFLLGYGINDLLFSLANSNFHLNLSIYLRILFSLFILVSLVFFRNKFVNTSWFFKFLGRFSKFNGKFTGNYLFAYVFSYILGIVCSLIVQYLGFSKFLVIVIGLVLLFVSLLNFKLGILFFVFFMPAQFVLGGMEIGTFSLTPFKILGIVIFISWIYNLSIGKIKFKFDKLGLAILIFSIISLFSIIFSDYLSMSINSVSTIFLFFILYLILMSSIDNFSFIKKIFYTLTISGVISAFLGIMQSFNFTSYGLGAVFMAESIIRASGFIGDANDFGVFMISLLPFIFYFYFQEESKLRKVFLAVSFLIISSAIFLSVSRSVLLAAVIIFPILFYKKIKKKEVIFAIIILIVILLYLSPAILSRFSSYTLERGVNQRVLLLKDSLYVFQHHPLSGIGYGTIRNYIYLNFVTHNAYLQIAAETGIFGLLAFLAVLFISFKNLYLAKKKYFEEKYRERFLIASSLQLALVAYVIIMFFLSFYYDKLLWLFIILTGVVYSLSKND